MPDFWGVTTLSFQVATPYFFDAVVPYGPRTECGHVYMTHGDQFMTFRHTPIWADNRHCVLTVSLGHEQRPATSLKYLQRRVCNGVDLDLLPLNSLIKYVLN